MMIIPEMVVVRVAVHVVFPVAVRVVMFPVAVHVVMFPVAVRVVVVQVVTQHPLLLTRLTLGGT